MGVIRIMRCFVLIEDRKPKRRWIPGHVLLRWQETALPSALLESYLTAELCLLLLSDRPCISSVGVDRGETLGEAILGALDGRAAD